MHLYLFVFSVYLRNPLLTECCSQGPSGIWRSMTDLYEKDGWVLYARPFTAVLYMDYLSLMVMVSTPTPDPFEWYMYQGSSNHAKLYKLKGAQTFTIITKEMCSIRRECKIYFMILEFNSGIYHQTSLPLPKMHFNCKHKKTS